MIRTTVGVKNLQKGNVWWNGRQKTKGAAMAENKTDLMRKALENLSKHRDDLIRALAEQYDEDDKRGRLDKLPKIQATIIAIKKAMEERDDEQDGVPDMDPEEINYPD
jgi:nuclear transport factor 2 (NTF2) superfamily protein